MLKKMNKIAAITMLLSVMGTSTAFAATETVVTGGSRSIDGFAADTFTPLTLDGKTQKTTSIVTPTTLIDATGTGAGWHVTLDATQFENINTLDTLPLNSLALKGVNIVLAETGSSDAADITATGIGTIDNGSSVTILDANTNEGMGTYTITLEPLELTLLPKDAKAGTYTTEITMTLTQGPSI